MFLYPTTGTAKSRIYISNTVINNGIADTLTFGGKSGQPHEYFYIRYNDSKKFSITGSNNYHINTVALHEFGHALGLDHVGWSLLPNSRAHIMYVNYTTHKPLHPHDIQGLKAIYGN